MAVFKFKLLPYQRLLQHKKEAAELDLSLKLARLKEVRGMLMMLEKEQEALNDNLDQRLKTGMNSEEYRMWVNRIESLEQEVSRLEEMLRELEIEVEQAKKRLLDIHIKERLVERLRERSFKAFQMEEAKRYQVELDDLANSIKSIWSSTGESHY